MRCPKCGYDNPSGTLFCEECDWRMDQPVKAEMGFPKEYVTIIAVIIGVISVVLWFLDVFFGAIALGAIGMVLGGYSMTFVRYNDVDSKMIMLVLTGVAICTSVIGFILGLGSL